MDQLERHTLTKIGGGKTIIYNGGPAGRLDMSIASGQSLLYFLMYRGYYLAD